jgi:ParB family chromosome partitioning protein
LDVDVAACWRPTASTYWGRVNKGHAVSMARKLVGDDYAEERSRERKGDIAAAMERAFAEQAAETEGFDAAIATKTARWLPEGMAFQGIGDASEKFNAPDNAIVTSAEGADVSNSDAEDAAPDALPAFLSETAA